MELSRIGGQRRGARGGCDAPGWNYLLRYVV